VPTNRFLDESDDYYDSESQAGGYVLEHRMNESLKLRQNLRHNRYEVDQRNVQGLSLQPDRRTVNPFASAANSTTTSLTVDTSAEVTWASGALGHVTLFGVDYRKFDYEDRGFVDPAVATIDLLDPVYGRPVSFGTTPWWHYRQNQSQVGYYVQEQARYGNWRLLLGGRRDLVHDNFQDLLTSGAPPTTERDSAFTGRVGLVYLTDSGFAPYASYTESFEPQTGASFALQPFDPRGATQYEIGVR
jgi:iron complex outermembrane receptor protein